ncbi:hypothetical protein NQZ68_021004 [Dissostichus eleginoides]|nr:hypothetical protein NQZ68_021004 [Dissostichus eleginoides]
MQQIKGTLPSVSPAYQMAAGLQSPDIHQCLAVRCSRSRVLTRGLVQQTSLSRSSIGAARAWSNDAAKLEPVACSVQVWCRSCDGVQLRRPISMTGDTWPEPMCYLSPAARSHMAFVTLSKPAARRLSPGSFPLAHPLIFLVFCNDSGNIPTRMLTGWCPSAEGGVACYITRRQARISAAELPRLHQHGAD